jgi:hypothetical protein
MVAAFHGMKRTILKRGRWTVRGRVLFLGTMFLLGLALPASAQQFSSASLPTAGGVFPAGSPGFFAAPLMKPNVAPPLNLASMMPSFAGLRNTMMLRNVFNSPQAVMQLPGQQAPPPRKTRAVPLFQSSP